ncbi:F-box/WD repeat-containing protein 7 [Elsinoe australis]|uniref:F-box/WD repeat-containing protein 7 n=1 Tax=Elsinoe australis TaxID=40998 RepID=A0A2P7YGB8_9PEZI|nr:F-box/WD repeat-containing protein 7 [Elsinoe australis]
MEDDHEWMSSYQRQQSRPVSLPMPYETDDQMPLQHSKSNTSHIFAPRHSRPIAVPSPAPSMPIPIPSNPNVIPGNTLPSAPASPPTPAPSPSPKRRAPDWRTAAAHEDMGFTDDEESDAAESSSTFQTRGRSKIPQGLGYRHIRGMFADMGNEERKRLLAEILNMCDGKTLGFVAGFVGPRLKRDPFGVLPNELCLRILTFIDDATTLARSSQVSKRWHELVSDDMAWKSLCEKHAYRRMSDDPSSTPQRPSPVQKTSSPSQPSPSSTARPPLPLGLFRSPSTSDPTTRSKSLDRASSISGSSRTKRRPKAMTYRSHFKQKYQVETAWRAGGHVDQRQITPDQGVVTSLHLTDRYIIVALDNAKIHVFDTEGRHLKCLQGHVMGVWAMVPWGDTLVSGGCDRDVRVWDMSTGRAVHMLRGHTSTVRCLKMADATTAISGSRDTTLRIWDIETGHCKHILVGHQSSVRCLEIHGDLVVSGSYDTTARIWSISQGRCLRTLQGHFSQIYAVAFDGKRVATGSLDTSVRVWDPTDGKCLGILQGHTSLVGQLQLRGDTLVTGGSDGSVRVWSMTTHAPIHRLAAHDNSVTSLQFDDSRIVSGGSDGRVKVWDLQRGTLIRELGAPAEAVWRVVFEEEKAVVLASRQGKTVMEVWSFSPPSEDGASAALGPRRFGSPVSLPERVMHDDDAPRSASLGDAMDEGFGRLDLKRDGEERARLEMIVREREEEHAAMVREREERKKGKGKGKEVLGREAGERLRDVVMEDADSEELREVKAEQEAATDKELEEEKRKEAGES